MTEDTPIELSVPTAPPVGRMDAAVQRGQDAVRQVVRLLAAVTAGLRIPLLLVALAPVVPALLVILAGIRQAPTFALVCAIIGLVPSAWLMVRRQQLITALHPPQEAAEEILTVVTPGLIWEEVRANLEGMRGRSVGGLRKVWNGVRLSGQLHDRFAEMPRIRPLLPGRLRGIAMLAVACVVAAAALSLLFVLELIVLVFGVW